jgi:copper chaperone CopZ
MKTFLSLILFLFCVSAAAQYRSAYLQASGLTCAMCSNAINKSVSKLPFVETVEADLNNSAFVIQFKKDMPVSFDELKKKVEEAGFSVALLKVTATVTELKVKKGEVVSLGGLHLWFVNASSGVLTGETTFSLMEKGFLTTKEFKKSGNTVTNPAYESAVATGKRVYVVSL